MFYILDALVYHNDPVGSTSEQLVKLFRCHAFYTIMTR